MHPFTYFFGKKYSYTYTHYAHWNACIKERQISAGQTNTMINSDICHMNTSGITMAKNGEL